MSSTPTDERSKLTIGWIREAVEKAGLNLTVARALEAQITEELSYAEAAKRFGVHHSQVWRAERTYSPSVYKVEELDPRLRALVEGGRVWINAAMAADYVLKRHGLAAEAAKLYKVSGRSIYALLARVRRADARAGLKRWAVSGLVARTGAREVLFLVDADCAARAIELARAHHNAMADWLRPEYDLSSASAVCFDDL